MDTPLRRFCRRIRRRRGPFDRFIGGARRPHAVFGPLRHPFSRSSAILGAATPSIRSSAIPGDPAPLRHLFFRYPAILDDHDRRGSLFLDHWGFWPSMARRGHTWTPSDIPFLDYRRFWTFLIGLDALPGDSSAPCTRHKLCLAPPSSRDTIGCGGPPLHATMGDRWVAVCDHSGLWGGRGTPFVRSAGV